jgi:hypothetical protein
MDVNPFKYDTANKRLVIGTEKPSTVWVATGALFVASTYLYSRSIFRVDRNGLNFAAFVVGSSLASYGFADYALGDANMDAGALNNAHESNTE